MRFRLACFLFLAATAWSADGGGIAGVVFGPGGEPVPAARVSLVLRATGFRRELVSDEAGKYAVTGLPAGSYAVSARSVVSGAAAEESAVVCDGETLSLPIVLGKAPVADADLPLAGRDALDLVRNRSEITPGEQGGNIEGFGPYGFRGSTSLNSYGQRGQDNNFLLDGVDDNNAWVRGALFTPPLDAVGAATVAAGYIPAEYGRATGAVVNLRTRSGSDELRGSAFEYWRNSLLDARNFFDGRDKPGLAWNQFGGAVGGPVRPGKWFFFLDSELQRGRQGVTVTSTVPTQAQKAGDFGAAATIYDPLSIHSIGGNLYARNPLPDNRILASDISQASRSLMALYPDPTAPGLAGNYSFASGRVLNSGQFDLRSDHVLSPASRFFIRLSSGSADGRSPGGLPAPAGMGFPAGSYAGSDPAQNADGVNSRETWQSGAASHTFAIGPLVNEARAGVSIDDLHAYAADRGFNASAALGIPGLSSNGMPAFSPLGYASLGAGSAAPFAVRGASYQLGDAVAWKIGRHSWKLGAQFVRRHLDGDASDWSSRGVFSFTPDFTGQPGVPNTGDSLASLMFGYPSEVRRDVQFAPYRLRAWEWAGFVQDSIRLWGRLTVEAGVNYSLFPPVTEASSRMVNFNFSRTAPALDQFAGQGAAGQYANQEYNKRALAPRFGFALDLLSGGAAVLRGGFSQSWDSGAYFVLGSLARNPPFASKLDTVNGTFQVGPSLGAGLPAPVSAPLLNLSALNSAEGGIYAIENSPFTPYSDQWNLLLDLRPRSGLTVEIGGMGSMGMHLYSREDSNQPYPAPTPFPYPRYAYDPYHMRIEYLDFAGGSTYYGGTFKLTGRWNSGPQFQLSYTFAKALDDATTPGTDQQSRPPVPQYLYNPRGMRSPSTFDVSQRLVFTAHYELPRSIPALNSGAAARRLGAALANWRIYANAVMQGGLPFTPQLAANSLNDGGIQLPNRIGSGALPAGQQSYLQWFNTSLNPADPNRAFQTPAVFQYGNSGFDILRGPGMASLDSALAKSIPLTERLRIRTRIEAFNLLNRVNFALPNRILGLSSSGAIDHTATSARRLQLSVRFEW